MPPQRARHRLLVLLLAACAWTPPRAPAPVPVPPPAPGTPHPVKVGVVLPPEGVPEGEALLEGARLAVDEANRAGGYRGRPFELVVRREEGAWGSGARKIADLAAVERVWALLGAVEGRSAHLAQQVVTKAHLAFVTPWSTDPGLSRINLPWFFRLVPDDRQQADVLAAATARARRVVTVAEAGYDGRTAEAAYARSLARAGRSAARRLTLRAGETSLHGVLDTLRTDAPDALVLFGRPARMAALVRALPAGTRPDVFAPLSLDDPTFGAAAAARSVRAFVLTAGDGGAAGRRFEQAFRQRYGRPPARLSAYAYDGLRLIVAAVQRAGLDRTRIQQALAATDADGATGPLRFDRTGNRVCEVSLRPVGPDGAGRAKGQ